jgi:subtilisin family serine protease
LFGAEYADSAGVDVINSSLGYYDFDPPYDNADHTYADLDGKTTLISRAAQWAVEAGMVVVNSAGNEGTNAWRRIIVPADAPGVLAVGGVDQTNFRSTFSSVGPSADGRVKPDLAARATGVVVGLPNGRIGMSSGTSFASPLVAGLAAGFWQAHPNLTAAQVTEALRRSGSQYGSPDDFLGYGIPNFERASVLAEAYNKLLIYPNPFSEAEPLSVFWGDIDPNVPLDATLINTAGRVLWRGRYTTGASTSFVLPNLGLPAGLYYMTLVAGDKKRTTKVVKR